MKRAIAGCLILVFLAGCTRRREPVDRRAVWRAIQPLAARRHLNPHLVYALVDAESGFDARAQNGEARGLMQLSPNAWQTVSRLPYEPAVWHWRTNLATGIDYLAWCRDRLRSEGHYSEPLLAATFHFGYRYVASRHFDLRRLPRPRNDIYRRLRRGDAEPVRPPGKSD